MEQVIKTSKCTIVALLIPEGAKDFKVHGLNRSNNLLYYLKDGYAVNKKFDFDVELIGFAHEIKEKQASRLVEEAKNEFYQGYKDYFNGISALHSAKESLHSLLFKKKCYKTNPYTEPNPEEYESDDIDDADILASAYEDLCKDWYNAKKRSGNWLILIKK